MNLLKRNISWPLAGMLVFIIAFVISCKENLHKKAPPPQINVVEVIQKDVPIYDYFVGQIYGQEDVSINARVEGFLTGIYFEEGSRVEKGKLLYTIDPQSFIAAVARERSNVAEAQTQLLNAENELARYKPLAEINAVSKSDLDFAQANRDASMAGLEAAKASLRMAEIKLGYTKVKSPIKGFIGKTQARVGEFVGRSPNPVILNTVSKIDTIRVHFFITESQYLTLAKEFDLSKIKPRKERIEGGHLSLILADGSVHPYKGSVDFINREVDVQTGAIMIQATFPNPELILRPGQFARVKVRMKDEKGALLVPKRCVSELQGEYSIFIVNSENKIEARSIKIDEGFEDYWIVSEGLKPGEKVVLEGLQKVGSGMEVTPVVTKFKSQINTQ